MIIRNAKSNIFWKMRQFKNLERLIASSLQKMMKILSIVLSMYLNILFMIIHIEKIRKY